VTYLGRARDDEVHEQRHAGLQARAGQSVLRKGAILNFVSWIV
jgi:hypothetical protein